MTITKVGSRNIGPRYSPLIALPDYERIFRVIHGVLLSESGTPSKACLYFGLFGAEILKQHHRVSAKPVVGAAAYNVGAPQRFAFAAGILDGALQSSETGFHCWVEAEGWAIDFFAPLLNELGSSESRLAIEPKMFQKPLSGMAPRLEDLATPGTYRFEPNPELERRTLTAIWSKQANKDLLEICVDWYRPFPRKMHGSIGIANQHGKINEVCLSPITLRGAW